MKKKTLFITLLASIALSGCGNSPESATVLQDIGTMPEMEAGYGQGVSACYAAIYDGSLYIAGGCNFPDIPAADGGAKRYYKGIYKAALGDTLVWEQIASLPEASAYGASVQQDGKWYIAGGMNACGSQASVYRINLDNGCDIDTLPPLPCTIDNTAGAMANNRLFIVGGNNNGAPSNDTYMLDIANGDKWQTLPEMPSRSRVQPACAATDNALYIWGGFTPADSIGNATTHTDGICYNFAENKWEGLNDICINDKSQTVSGGCAATLDDSTIIVAGGVNKEIFTDAISGTYSLIEKEQYMHQPAEWYRFNPNLLAYDINSGKWKSMYCDKTFARAGATIVIDKQTIYYIGGELKPGIRTAKITRFKTK